MDNKVCYFMGLPSFPSILNVDSDFQNLPYRSIIDFELTRPWEAQPNTFHHRTSSHAIPFLSGVAALLQEF